VLLGCSNADFDVPSESDAAVDTTTPSDTSEPVTDSNVADTSTTPEVIGTDTCAANACGGCGPLSKEPKTPCGVCMTSQTVCDGTTNVKCEKPDDRTDGRDEYFKGYDGNGLTLSGTDSVAISFLLMHAGSPTSLTLAMQRYDVSPGTTVGNLQVRLIKGTPTTTVEASNVLASSLIAATLIPDTPNTIVVVLPAIAPMAKGTPLWIEITDHSELSNFAINGAAGTLSDLRFFFSSGSGYMEKTGLDPYLVVGMKACF